MPKVFAGVIIINNNIIIKYDLKLNFIMEFINKRYDKNNNPIYLPTTNKEYPVEFIFSKNKINKWEKVKSIKETYIYLFPLENIINKIMAINQKNILNW